MKRRFVAICVCLISLCVALAGCDGVFPYADKTVPNLQPKYFTVYVCGAVKNEGYITVEAGTGYTEVFFRAGLLPQSALPLYYTDTVEQDGEIAVGYFENGERRYCLDVNGYAVVNRDHSEDIPDEVINLIADYIQLHGKIRNKLQLDELLGSYSQDYLYKFFVARQDYAMG